MLASIGVPVEGGPIGVMRHEHEIGRAAVAALFKMGDDSDAGNPPNSSEIVGHLRDLAGFYEHHIWKEDNVLFPAANRLLTEAIDAELTLLYDKAEEAHGHEVHCEQATFADAAEKRFLGG